MGQLFIQLFAGNNDAVGTEEGGCLRRPVGAYDDVSWWERQLWRHLDDNVPVGVYPVRYGQVHWGCVDFDEGEEESFAHAVNLTKVLAKFNVHGWMERSRSKGYHVWCFHNPGVWMAAPVVRRGLLVACALVGAPVKEINPKSEELAPDQLGNYVRLPYPGWLGGNYFTDPAASERRVMVTATDGSTIELKTFVKYAMQGAGLQGLNALADLYTPPVPRLAVMNYEEPDAELDELASMMTYLTKKIWREGPLDGSDRSGTLYKLAVRLEADGFHTPSESLALLRDADRRWGKHFEDRPGGLKYLAQIIEKAFNIDLEVDE
jgi:hypothetical protein